MRIVLALVLALAAPFAVFAASTPAKAEATKSSHAGQIICHKTTERVGGLKKTCYYDCGSWEGGLQENVYDHCAAWTVRWRLNHNSQFGPHPRVKSSKSST
jgi:hypothetical protein